ncbi:MAG: hypothetical protein LLG15_11105 [Betaproteobacteria bacterium]|nr:hypothetical protein [Betaproteobacteria bacterium]
MPTQRSFNLMLEEVPEDYLRAAHARCRIHAPFEKVIENRSIYLCLRNVALALWKNGVRRNAQPVTHERADR